MSGLFSDLSIAAGSLEADSFALDVTGQNIANVNTPGYTRKEATFTAIPPSDIRSAGGGVLISKVQGARDQLVETRLIGQQSVVSREGSIADNLSSIQAALGGTGTSIDQALNSFFDAFSTLAQDPTSAAARYQVGAQGQALAKTFNDVSGRLVQERTNVDAQVRSAVTQVNTLTQSIAAINGALYGASSATAETLKDQLSSALQQLSGLVDIQTIRHDDGSVDVSIGNGRAVVAGQNAYDITATSVAPSGLAALSVGGIVVTSEITGGQIGGLLNVRDVLLPSYQAQLDNLAYGVATNVNTAHTAGFDLNGNPGINYFSPLAVPAGAAAALAVNPAILASTDLIAAGGTPSAGDNTNALAIAKLRATPIAGGTQNPLDAWSSLVYQVASDTNASTQNQTNAGEILKQTQTLRDQVSGVSLDEEAASLLKFQSAYQANAKYFSAVDNLLTTLLNLGTTTTQ
jgi:flagellar hook-associated protein 1 FlgK